MGLPPRAPPCWCKPAALSQDSRRSRSRDRRRSRSRDRDRGGRDRDRRRSSRSRSRSRSRDRRDKDRDYGYQSRRRDDQRVGPQSLPPSLLASYGILPGAGPSALVDRFAAQRAMAAAFDPLQRLRRQVENTLEAKVSMLQTKLASARDPKTRSQRKIYIGNLTPSINGMFLKTLFQETLRISVKEWDVLMQQGQEIVVDVQYRDGNKYAFLEFRTIEMATTAMQVDGLTVTLPGGSTCTLQVARPTGYVDPVESERQLREAEEELRKFRSGEDETPLLRQPGGRELLNAYRLQNGLPPISAVEASQPPAAPLAPFGRRVTSCGSRRCPRSTSRLPPWRPCWPPTRPTWLLHWQRRPRPSPLALCTCLWTAS